MGTVIRRRPGRAVLLALALVLGIGLLTLVPHGGAAPTASATPAPAPTKPAAPTSARPNIVTVMLDDLDQKKG